MRHPKYQIVSVLEKDGKRLEEVVSKSLMFKCDAQRVANYHNKSGSSFNKDGSGFYYIIREYKKKERVC